MHAISHNMQRAAQAGIDYYAIVPPAAGSTYTPASTTATEKEESLDDDGLIND